ncbi:hypothetical protein MR626_13205 [bacterium]|nr:hypothetical protein [bacterium]
MFVQFTDTNALKQSVKSAIREASGLSAVYPRKAPATQAPPFVVFLLDPMTVDGCISQYQLTVYVSGYGADESAIDDIADKIQFGMDYASYQDDRMAWDCYLTNRPDVEETDKNIIQRRLDFTLRYMGGKNNG